MDRATLKQKLAEAEQRVTLGEICIETVRGIIAELERDGCAGSHAKQALANMLETQATRLNDCSQLSKRLNPKRVECASRR